LLSLPRNHRSIKRQPLTAGPQGLVNIMPAYHHIPDGSEYLHNQVIQPATFIRITSMVQIAQLHSR
jgi:hypothetical protein